MEKGQLFEAIKMLELQRNVDAEDILDAIEEAILAAYKKKFGSIDNIRIDIDPENEDIKIIKTEEVPTDNGVKFEEKATSMDFIGWFTAQTAKQIILSKIKEAERERIYREYKDRTGELVTGTVRQTDRRFTILDLGDAEAILPPIEQIPGENYSRSMRLKAVVVEVKKVKNEPPVIVSRTHPLLVKRLFELEVPEIQQGIVEIKSIAREPGYRTKIAVSSTDKNVDPTGACVGPKGSRVKMVVRELNREKVDVVSWDSDPAKYVANSLSPARITKVIVDPATETAYVVVAEDQLSLAIGKEGQNARLAAKLTGLRIDIKSEKEAEGVEKQAKEIKEKEAEVEELLKIALTQEEETGKETGEEAKEETKEES